jgi:hypothetical protein
MTTTEKSYNVVNGTSYNPETPQRVCDILEYCRLRDIRVQLYYGDTKTGQDWHEENDTRGTIGRSTGIHKIPLLIHNTRSLGGGPVLDHCIVKIKETKTGTVLYQHQLYKAPVIDIKPCTMEGYQFETHVNGKLYGRHKTLASAERLKKLLA